jgi:hypothetical protein
MMAVAASPLIHVVVLELRAGSSLQHYLTLLVRQSGQSNQTCP